MDNDLQEITVKNLRKKDRFDGNIRWMALQDRYFATAFLPAAENPAQVRVSMIDGGLPVDVAYFIKTVRDSINITPNYRLNNNSPERRLACQKRYIDTIREIQAAVEGVKTKEDVLWKSFLRLGSEVARLPLRLSAD